MYGQATDYAGPDKSGCQGDGVTIGNASPGNVCYTWDAADGLNPNDIHNSNPHVRPQNTTTYTVHVVGNNFSFSTTDQVKVTVAFGGLVITPSYINLAGPQMNQATAMLTVNPSNNPIIWSIPDAAMTGCNIDQNGVISGCNATGTVTVKATNQNDPGCVAEKTLEINGGVKDVIASDNANDGRVAHKTQTLYLVGPNTPGPAGSVNFTAVPNENSSFPSGQPTWSGPLMPPPGNEYSWDTPNLGLGTYTETVGQVDPKTVTVSVVGPNEASVTINVNTGLVETLINKLKGNTKVKETDAFCSTPLSFSLPGALSASFKASNAPKFHDPAYATKKEVSVDIPGISVTGCVYFPCCTGAARFGPAYIYYFTYFGSSLGLNLNVAAAKDPSASANAMWTMSNLSASVSGKLEAGLRVESEFSMNAGIFAGVNISTEGKLECRFMPTPDRLEWNASWGGLVGKVSAAIWYGNPSNAIEVAFQKNLINGSETGWMLLDDLSAH